MRKLSVSEAETRLSELLEAVEGGERIVIERAGEPVAVLVPYAEATPERTLGLAEGEVRIADDFDELPGDLAGAFGVST